VGFFGRDFRDGSDGEADWPAGPWQVRDSRQGGRQRRWGGSGPSDGGRASGIRGTRAEGRREGRDDRGFREVTELSGKVLKTRVI
jgi:hypothetical protein